MGYRNKCEFSIGPGVDGKATVGFLLGSFRDGFVQVLTVNCVLTSLAFIIRVHSVGVG